jgi:glucose/arabinose dehydrogenase
MRRLATALIALSAAAIVPAQELPGDLRFDSVVSGLNQPLGVRHAGDARLFVIQQGGQIRIVDGGSLLPTAFLNINSGSGGTAPPLGFTSGGERGLLGLAFDPAYASNRRFYLYYTDGSGDTVVARYLTSVGDEDLADAGSGQVVLRVDQDFSNHNGGDIQFGLDGMLYIGLGDGGDGNDPCNRSQTLDPAQLNNSGNCQVDGAFTGSGGDPDSRALLGKLLRIDVSAGGTGAERCGAGGSQTGYAIPSDNPYAATDSICDEVFANGLRNPYRFSVDRLHGDFWIGDVGQGAREEVDRLPAAIGGLNFGWRCREGFIATPGISCGTTPTFTDPISDHPRDEARSITGGYRYRGPIGGLSGLVFYGDFVTGRQFVLNRRSGQWVASTWRNTGGNPAGYGEGLDGHLYMADYGGTLFRLEATSPVIFFSGMESDE